MRRIDIGKGPPATVNDELLGPRRTDSPMKRKTYAISDAFKWPNGPKSNIGCGSDIRQGDDWVNIDKYPVNDQVLPVDVEKGVLPFDDDHFAAILCIDFLEHIPHRSPHVDGELFYVVINELIRVSRPGAQWLVISPARPDSLAMAGHCRVVTESTWVCFSAKRRASSAERVTIAGQLGHLKIIGVRDIREWNFNKYFGRTRSKCVSLEVEK